MVTPAPGNSETGLDGATLSRAFRAAADHLAAVAADIDAINVYPVPDGDTGTNMAATLRAAVDAIEDTSAAGVVLAAMAKGALYGARGNSGVILSQAIRGLATATRDAADIDAATLCAALRAAADEAYRAIAEPQEGTMLTVLRAAADGAIGEEPLAMLASALAAAEEAERHTIDQLPKLREAGVTDAGGEGICAILRGLRASLAGEALPQPAHGTAPLARLVEHGEEFGFCTEFMLLPRDGQAVDTARLRALAQAGGNRSVIVVGDPALMRVHVHTDDPDALLAQVAELGQLDRVKIDDMGAQHQRLRERQATPSGAVALLAICDGEGFATAFESVGVHVLRYPASGRPSVRAVVDAIEAAHCDAVVVLPNHKDLVPVARQAASAATPAVHVVPSTTAPQGIAACLAFEPDGTAAEVAAAMEAELGAVQTIELTIATADRMADGVDIREGEAIGILDGRVVCSRGSFGEALTASLGACRLHDAELVTVYFGAAVPEDEKARLGGLARACLQGAECELRDGGQALYPVVISVE